MFSRSHLEIWGGNFTQNMYQQMHGEPRYSLVDKENSSYNFHPQPVLTY